MEKLSIGDGHRNYSVLTWKVLQTLGVSQHFGNQQQQERRDLANDAGEKELNSENKLRTVATS